VNHSKISQNTDQNGHGTHTTSTTSGIDVGVYKQSTVIAVKVLDSTGSGSTSGVIAGVQWGKSLSFPLTSHIN
jgi:subtilisin family serine protease